jgi:putative lipase involved disintegration of autophagic bodies
MIMEFVKDKNKAALVFRMLESESKVKDEEIKMQQNLVSQFKPMFQNPQDKDLLKIVEKILTEAKSTNSYYRFILYVLEAIVLERPEVLQMINSNRNLRIKIDEHWIGFIKIWNITRVKALVCD